MNSTFSLALLIAATVLFILAACGLAPDRLQSAGLACFAGAFLVGRVG